MLAIALDLPPPPIQGVALTIMREQSAAPPAGLGIGIDIRTYLYDPGNSVTVGAGRGSAAEDLAAAYHPRTPLGRHLLALRTSYLNHGGKLLSADGLEEEMRARRGGLGDA